MYAFLGRLETVNNYLALLPIISIIVGMAKTIKEEACNKCDYTWYPRTTGKPKICPRCKSHKWNDKKK